MKLVHYILPLLAAVFPVSGEIHAQDLYFGQYFSNKILINPGFAGADNTTNFNINHKRQWLGVSGSYRSSAVSCDAYMAKFGGVGIIVTNDISGYSSIKTNTGSFVYSYVFKINRKTAVRAGFQAGLIQKSLDKSVHTYEDMIDQNSGFVYQTSENTSKFNLTNMDLSAGIVIHSHKFFGSLAIHHLNRPDITFGETTSRKLNMKFTLNGGVLIPVDYRNTSINLYPNIYYHY